MDLYVMGQMAVASYRFPRDSSKYSQTVIRTCYVAWI